MEILLTLLLFLFVALAVLATVGTIVWRLLRLRHVLRGRDAAARLAQELGFENLTPGRPPQRTWYGGIEQGRRAAVAVSKSPSGAVTYGYRDRLNLTLLLEVTPRIQLSGFALHRERELGTPARFEEAFEVQGDLPLSSAAQAQMLAFVNQRHGRGVRGMVPQLLELTRTLGLRGQSGSGPPFPDPRVLPGATALLVYDHPTTDLGAADCRHLFYELAVVAHAIEQGSPTD